ncbi:MAG: SMP-30/gluconolactonase/LRE family protein [Segetibacter sp.]
MALTPDQTQLYVTESASHWVWIYTHPAGRQLLLISNAIGWLHATDTEGNAWSDGLKCDKQGRVYVASRLGIQVLDQTGTCKCYFTCTSRTIF